jgi:hypothetical protein
MIMQGKHIPSLVLQHKFDDYAITQGGNGMFWPINSMTKRWTRSGLAGRQPR